MRDLKQRYPHLFNSFRVSSTKSYKPHLCFSYGSEQERLAYYNGQTTKSLLLKESMVGYPLFSFIRTKLTGKSIHQRKKKKKK